jgi:hypothetical protein
MLAVVTTSAQRALLAGGSCWHELPVYALPLGPLLQAHLQVAPSSVGEPRPEHMLAEVWPLQGPVSQELPEKPASQVHWQVLPEMTGEPFPLQWLLRL